MPMPEWVPSENFLDVSHLAQKIQGWLLNFLKLCGTLSGITILDTSIAMLLSVLQYHLKFLLKNTPCSLLCLLWPGTCQI